MQDKPGIWIPLTEEELTRAKELLEEIAALARTGQGSERHADKLAEFDLLIGFAAGCAAVAETGGPEAEQRWRAKPYSPWKEQMRLISEGMRVAWRRIRGDGELDKEKATVVELEERRLSKS